MNAFYQADRVHMQIPNKKKVECWKDVKVALEGVIETMGQLKHVQDAIDKVAQWKQDYTVTEVQYSFDYKAVLALLIERLHGLQRSDADITLLPSTPSTPLTLHVEWGTPRDKRLKLEESTPLETSDYDFFDGFSHRMEMELHLHDVTHSNRATRYAAYAAYRKKLKEWVEQFNSDWSEKAKLDSIRFEATTHRYDDLRQLESLGKDVVSIRVVGGGPDIKTMKPARLPADSQEDTSELDTQEAYRWEIDFFKHNVDIVFFFYNASEEVTQHARALIAGNGRVDRTNRERPPYAMKGGKPRTLLGMLSTWTTELAVLGVADMDWLKYKSPRAATLDDQWKSTKGRGGSRQIKKAATVARKIVRLVGSNGKVDEAVIRDRCRAMNTGPGVVDSVLSILRKSDRHGLEFTDGLLQCLERNGYYGMIRPTRDRQCTMIREVAATLCDVCA